VVVGGEKGRGVRLRRGKVDSWAGMKRGDAIGTLYWPLYSNMLARAGRRAQLHIMLMVIACDKPLRIILSHTTPDMDAELPYAHAQPSYEASGGSATHHSLDDIVKEPVAAHSTRAERGPAAPLPEDAGRVASLGGASVGKGPAAAPKPTQPLRLGPLGHQATPSQPCGRLEGSQALTQGTPRCEGLRQAQPGRLRSSKANKSPRAVGTPDCTVP
jgi:hypothetical protein